MKMRAARTGPVLATALLVGAGATSVATADPNPVVAAPDPDPGWPFALTPTANGADARSGNLRITWIDIVGIDAVLFETMSAEVESLLAPAGLRVSWNIVPPTDPARGAPLRVVLMASTAGAGSGDTPMLGSAHPRAPSPTVRVYHPSILHALGLRGSATPTLRPRPRRQVGVALGRVVAHEIVHTLRPDLPHAGHGLMASRLSLDSLLRGHMRIDAGVIAALREAPASH